MAAPGVTQAMAVGEMGARALAVAQPALPVRRSREACHQAAVSVEQEAQAAARAREPPAATVEVLAPTGMSAAQAGLEAQQALAAAVAEAPVALSD